MAGQRKIRMEEFLKREIATTLLSEVRDPRMGFITVTRTVMSPDLSKITAFYTVLGDEKQKRLTARALEDVKRFVQKSYAAHIHMRFVPLLSFAYDNEELRRQEMDALISAARATDPD